MSGGVRCGSAIVMCGECRQRYLYYVRSTNGFGYTMSVCGSHGFGVASLCLSSGYKMPYRSVLKLFHVLFFFLLTRWMWIFEGQGHRTASHTHTNRQWRKKFIRTLTIMRFANETQFFSPPQKRACSFRYNCFMKLSKSFCTQKKNMMASGVGREGEH